MSQPGSSLSVKCTLGPWPQGNRETTARWNDQLRQNTSWALVCAIWKILGKQKGKQLQGDLCLHWVNYIVWEEDSVRSIDTLVGLKVSFTYGRQNKVCSLKCQKAGMSGKKSLHLQWISILEPGHHTFWSAFRSTSSRTRALCRIPPLPACHNPILSAQRMLEEQKHIWGFKLPLKNTQACW